jgi:hypothetical protein
MLVPWMNASGLVSHLSSVEAFHVIPERFIASE